ncbi:hypothetical protein [Pseudomonas lactis]|uniref:hypothetical protein n=1 Tax=Pseudomonas lactis TaxID=1615674 RepID=UPI00110C8AD5|nr:hypothetical protein [Pseudomonas lactis]MBK3446343.1 hypothetical protein [Pseudomonas lactis]
MSNNYSVRQLTASEVPQYIDITEFEGGVWAALLDGNIVAVCFEKEMARAIASNHLATKTISLSHGPWFPLNMNGEKIGYCLGSVLPKANKFFGNE